MIIVVDFGSQSTHLISRRLREISIDSMLVEPEDYFAKTGELEQQGKKIDGVILSGGPQSVYDESCPRIDNKVFELGIPVLGICYGVQYMAYNLGGTVEGGKHKEFGHAIFKKLKDSLLFKLDEETQMPEESTVWMSHGDIITKLPEGFEHMGSTATAEIAAFQNPEKKMYGVLFHPELVHTQFGLQVLRNFVEICGLEPKDRSIDQEFVDGLIADIKDSVGDAKIVGAMSGGVDSSIANLMVHKAVGTNLTAIYIDSGLMREGETDALTEIFEKNYDMKVKVVHAKDEFLNNLKGVTDPEQKRKIIGKTFIDVFDREAQVLGAEYLVQGTIWPDVIESAGTKHANLIKSHHNVGGLPENMKLTLLEPIRNFYKDEVREIGKVLQLPDEIIMRKPFPGPGLAVRIIGEVTDEKLTTLRKADAILQEIMAKWEGTKDIWQVFAVHTGIKTTGVGGDYRSYGDLIAVRSINSKEVMSGTFTNIPYDILNEIGTRIPNEVKEVNRVVYDITNKPPGTIEWE